MAVKITLKAEKRKITGRKVKSLRRQGNLPANLFGKGIKSQSLKTKTSDFEKTFKQAGETNLVYLKIDSSKEIPVLISNVHLHPVTSQYLHADLYQVDLTKKVTVNVPVNLIGESPAVEEGAVLVQTLKELEVEALPTNIPKSIDFNLSGLAKIGDSLKIENAQTLKDADIVQNKDTVIVQIQAQQEEEPQLAPETETETPAEGQEAKEETQQEESKEDSKPEEKPAEEKKN